jgi:osmotically inducible protein OsmC
METGEAGPSVVGVNLIVTAKVPGLDAGQFAAVADNAKKNCVISRALGVPITMSATLEG